MYFSVIKFLYFVNFSYVCQVMAEMKALCVSQLLYVCWSPVCTSVLLVSFDHDLWKDITACILAIYGGDRPKKLTRVIDEVAKLRKSIKDFSKNVKLLCVVPSMKAFNEPTPSNEEHLLSNASLLDKLIHLKAALKEAFQLARRRAAETHVWILSDTDRISKAEEPYALPVAYVLLGTVSHTRP